jgi:hypothetical protein
MDCAPACTPRAKRISSFGALVVTRATLLDWSIAAPAACIRRSATRAPSEGARPQAAEATVKRANPQVYTSLRPVASPIRPAGASMAIRPSR